MELSDITVEVRDREFQLVGQIPRDDFEIEAAPLHNRVGVWSVTLPYEHPMCEPLMQPGAGVVISDANDVVISGPTEKWELAVSPDDIGGTVTFSGIGDEIILSDRLAYPQPSNADPTTQTVERDTRTGPVETIMHGFVNANVGPGAPTARRSPYLVMGTNGARGSSTSKSARFPTLQELLAELAPTGDLGYRVVQRGPGQISFETYAINDRTDSYPLSLHNDTISGYKIAQSPPGATRVLVAGQGEGTARQFIHVSTPESVAAEQAWGRRIERFIDQRNTDVIAELQQAADEVLSVEGFGGLAIQAVPTEYSFLEYGRDWFLGDKLAVNANGLDIIATATGYVLKVDSDGIRTGMVLGEDWLLDPNGRLTQQLKQVGSRTSNLERQ